MYTFCHTCATHTFCNPCDTYTFCNPCDTYTFSHICDMHTPWQTSAQPTSFRSKLYIRVSWYAQFYQTPMYSLEWKLAGSALVCQGVCMSQMWVKVYVSHGWQKVYVSHGLQNVCVSQVWQNVYMSHHLVVMTRGYMDKYLLVAMTHGYMKKYSQDLPKQKGLQHCVFPGGHPSKY